MKIWRSGSRHKKPSKKKGIQKTGKGETTVRSLCSDDRVYALEQISRMVARSRRYCQDEGREDDVEFYRDLRRQAIWGAVHKHREMRDYDEEWRMDKGPWSRY